MIPEELKALDKIVPQNREQLQQKMDAISNFVREHPELESEIETYYQQKCLAHLEKIEKILDKWEKQP